MLLSWWAPEAQKCAGGLGEQLCLTLSCPDRSKIHVLCAYIHLQRVDWGAARSETVRLIRRLHQFDVMRANKAPFAWGLEPRVPFLDKQFLETSMGIDPADKMVRWCWFRVYFHSTGLGRA